MKLDGIAALVAIAEAGSISEAARRLRLAKSVVSERLAELERQLGGKMFHRTTRKLTLTEDGAAFLEHAARITREVEEAAASFAERRGTLSGPMRLSAPVTFGRMHLGPALWPFLQKHPDITLNLDLNDRRIDVASEGFDAVIRHGIIEESRLMVWRLAPSRRVFVASPDYLARRGVPRTIEDLEGHDGIFYSNRGGADWRLVGPDGVHLIRAKGRLILNNGDLMREAAMAGQGICLMPSFITWEALKAGRLVAVDVGVQPEEESIFIAHPEGRQPSAKLRALADHLRLAFGSPPYWDA